MKTEIAIDYTKDINSLLNLHRETISKKLAYLLTLMIAQTPEVRENMIQKAINEEFGFIFSNSKKTYTEQFKSTLRSVLINALTNGYDKHQAKMHVYGYALKTVPTDEFGVLRRHYVTHIQQASLPDKEKIPHLVNLLNEILEFENKFESLPGFRNQTAGEIASYTILTSSYYGKSGYDDTVILPMVGRISLLILIELGITLSYFLSSDEKDNAKVIPIIATSMMINTIAFIALFKTAATLIVDIQRRKSSALHKANHGLSEILPKLIVKKIIVEEKRVYSYELPIFKKAEAPTQAPSTDTEYVNADQIQQQRKKVKSRPAYASGLFKSTPKAEPVPSNIQIDEITRDGITYRRRYNQSGPTNDFIGYNNDELEQQSRTDNLTTFKKLLDEPKSVAPKGRQGIVRMTSTAGVASFKLKSKGDERLLFSQVGEEELNGQTIRLYKPNQSKTHNQMNRMKQ